MAKRKMEFSKKIFVGVSIGTVVVTAFSMIIVWRTNDTMPLSYLIPAVFGEFATATAFYYGKAREENKIKLAAIYKVPPEAFAGDTADAGATDQGDVNGTVSS